jgi:hypothetical protein
MQASKIGQLGKHTSRKSKLDVESAFPSLIAESAKEMGSSRASLFSMGPRRTKSSETGAHSSSSSSSNASMPALLIGSLQTHQRPTESDTKTSGNNCLVAESSEPAGATGNQQGQLHAASRDDGAHATNNSRLVGHALSTAAKRNSERAMFESTHATRGCCRHACNQEQQSSSQINQQKRSQRH